MHRPSQSIGTCSLPYNKDVIGFPDQIECGIRPKAQVPSIVSMVPLDIVFQDHSILASGCSNHTRVLESVKGRRFLPFFNPFSFSVMTL